MLNNANGTKIDNRRIRIALVVSLSLHLVLLWQFGMLSPGLPTTQNGALQVTLLAPAAKILAPAEPQASAVAEGMPSPQEVKVIASEPVRVNAPVVAKIPAEPIPVAAASAASPSKLAQETEAQPNGLPRPGPAGAARRVEIEFEIFSGSGAERQSAGKGRHVYTSQNDQSFGVSIKQILKADESAQDTSWQLEISGRIDRQGLSPLVYEMQGALPERLMALKEPAGSPSAFPGGRRSGRMPDGILDRQSLLYQFMLVPPSNGGGKLWLSNGTTYGLYDYRIAGYESLAIPSIGNVQTMKLVFTAADSPEIIELWLIPDKRYLPARVRYTDKLGLVTEQLVVSLEAK